MTPPPEDIRRVRSCPECGSLIISVPLLQRAHCGKVLAPRCFWRQKGSDLFLAECVDLDLISQGKTAEEAIGKLQEAMYGYLALAFAKSTAGLVIRPSPLSHRLRYRWHLLHERLRDRLTKGHAHFVLPTALLNVTRCR